VESIRKIKISPPVSTTSPKRKNGEASTILEVFRVTKELYCAKWVEVSIFHSDLRSFAMFRWLQGAALLCALSVVLFLVGCGPTESKGGKMSDKGKMGDKMSDKEGKMSDKMADKEGKMADKEGKMSEKSDK
jgi:hypothetical protein